MLETLQAAMKKAMLAKDTIRLSVVRMLISEVKNENFTTQKKRTPDEVVAAYRKKLAKIKEEFSSRTDQKSIDFSNIVDAEIKIVSEFLPDALTEDDVRVIISNANLTDISMKTVMPLLKGKVFDGKMVQNLIGSFKL